MRMWDLRANKCEGLMETPTRSAIAFDQQVASWLASCYSPVISPCEGLYHAHRSLQHGRRVGLKDKSASGGSIPDTLLGDEQIG